MFVEKPVKVWRPGQPLRDKAFLSFGELADYEAQKCGKRTSSSFMTSFSHLIFRGAFDSEPLDHHPFVDRMTIDQSLRYLQIPLIDAQFDKKSNMLAGSAEFLGYGCANSEDVIVRLALMHQWFEYGSERKTVEELTSYKNDLLTHPFESYPDKVQGFLNDTLIAKEKLKEWYRLRGTSVPWPLASNDNALTLSPAGKPSVISANESRSTPRGRPPKSAWTFIKHRSRQLRRADKNLLNKVIASMVLDEASSDFNKDDLPAHSTVVKELGKILEGL